MTSYLICIKFKPIRERFTSHVNLCYYFYCSEVAIGRSPFGFSVVKFLKNVFIWRAVTIAFVMEKRFKLHAAKEFFKFLFDRKCVFLLAIGSKLRPLLRTDFSWSDCGKLLGIVTTASWLSLGGSRLLEGPTRLVNFCVLIEILASTEYRVSGIKSRYSTQYSIRWTRYRRLETVVEPERFV